MTGALLALSATAWLLLLPACLSPFRTCWFSFVCGMSLFIAAVLPICAAIFVWDLYEKSYTYKQVAFAFTGLGALYVPIIGGWLLACSGDSAAAQFLRYRAIDLFSGGSPALPLVLLTAILLLQFVLRLKQFSDAGAANRPRLYLDCFDQLPLKFYYKRIEETLRSSALVVHRGWIAFAFLAAVIAAVAAYWLGYVSAFEPHSFNWVICFTLAFFLLGLVICCYDFVRLWRLLSHFLRFVEVLPLRQSFFRVTARWPRWSLWSLAPPPFLSKCAQQIMSAAHNWMIASGTEHAKHSYKKIRAAYVSLLPKAGDADALLSEGSSFEFKQAHFGAQLKLFRDYQHEAASLCEQILAGELLPHWKASINDRLIKVEPSPPSQVPTEENRLRYGADFVALQIASYVIYACVQVRQLARCLYIGVLLLILVMMSYSPQAPLIVSRFLAVVFVIVAYFIIKAFVAMEKDITLSIISKTKPGQLNSEFWFKIAGLGAPLLLAIMAHLFPPVSNFLFKWISPGTDALR